MSAQTQALLQCAQARQAREILLRRASVGVDECAACREDIRGDFTCWLREPLYPAERSLLERLEELRLELNREATLGLFELELHYARYPPGAGYARHVDQPLGTSLRQVSLVLYLNADRWRPSGGEACYACTTRTIERWTSEPVGGRLVCFLTPGAGARSADGAA